MVWGSKRLRNLIDIGMILHADARMVNPASINLRLGHTYLRPEAGQTVRLGEEIEYADFKLEDGECIRIAPGEFLLATTMERVMVPLRAAAFVQGRSSIGRAALSVQNAGYIDPGFDGHITLELKNEGPCTLLLYPGYPVAQLVFMEACDVEEGYNGKYVGQVEATGSRMYLDGITPETALKGAESDGRSE